MKRVLIPLVSSFVLSTSLLCHGQQSSASPSSLVNPFLGSAPLLDPEITGYTPPENWRVWAGLTYPGSALPNAMVQLSPITEYGSGAGYEYEDTEILGFTHTNKGHWNLCNIPILPVSGEGEYPFKSKFSHDQEKASPGFYQVFLDDSQVGVRLTSTLRCGFHEYTFKNAKDRRILFDLNRANNRVSEWEIEQNGDHVVSGFQRVGGDKIYFYAELSHQIDSLEQHKSGRRGFAMIHLSDGNDNPVSLKIGLSFVSPDNAKQNLKEEIGDHTFDEIHKEAVGTWDTLLSKVKIQGGSEKQQKLFYSCLYRSFLWPALRSDCNGEFKDDSGKVRNEGFRYYTNPSLWDTFRNKLFLLGMLSPDVTGDVIQSLVVRGEPSGFMPTFFHGDHAAAFVTSSYLRGIRNFDSDKAYKELLKNAYEEGGTRPHIAEYIEKGYISDPDVKHPNTETKASAGVSKTLEYAYDDYSLAQLAKAMGDDAHYEDLMKRSKNYANMFDPETKFMRGRLENGDWISPFDPQRPFYEYMYREANAWQLSFFVPHDMPGLVKLYGGNEPFEKKLDDLFSIKWNPRFIARNVSGFLGQYCHGNQPDHEAPFSYYFVGKPEKSQAVIDTLLDKYYGLGESGNGLCGMDDAGEMSAWYVFAASGIYPLSTADNQFIVTLPIFDQVDWNVGGEKPVTIQAEGKSRKLKEIDFNGKTVDGYFLPYADFAKGGKLQLKTE
ncbi:GH92 family glycosyl hydrolase [Luteolibacter pohnpeiensis]|uniref:GH92 family glycosyl hydrolase n=1 Tax=Luteolibacter pohnpeiensis TaxID=454153 RepID=A0A934VVV5_9BACT|nr:GH92 family glycosyl hydrolase [Luteolibacter pohnpeiensis]MBK1883972.1 GH92 family glycosyl hydrolase [Luteolibacter pohnpeiensis]